MNETVEKIIKYMFIFVFAYIVINIIYIYNDITLNDGIIVKKLFWLFGNYETEIISGKITTMPDMKYIIRGVMLVASYFLCVIYLFSLIFIYFKDKKKKMYRRNGIQYYRDKLNKISPLYVSYLINQDIVYTRDISAEILKLKIDGYLEEVDNKYQVTKKDQSSLSSIDRNILLNINKKISSEKLENDIINDLKKEDYIKINNVTFNNMMPKIIIGVFISAIIFFILMFKYSNNEALAKTIFQIYTTVFVIVWCIFFIILAAESLYTKDYKRTKKGNVLYKDILGLRYFLKDFSTIKDAQLNEEILRDYYLVYSIIFEMNDDLVSQIMSKVK